MKRDENVNDRNFAFKVIHSKLYVVVNYVVEGLFGVLVRGRVMTLEVVVWAPVKNESR